MTPTIFCDFSYYGNEWMNGMNDSLTAPAPSVAPSNPHRLLVSNRPLLISEAALTYYFLRSFFLSFLLISLLGDVKWQRIFENTNAYIFGLNGRGIYCLLFSVCKLIVIAKPNGWTNSISLQPLQSRCVCGWSVPQCACVCMLILNKRKNFSKRYYFSVMVPAWKRI